MHDLMIKRFRRVDFLYRSIGIMMMLVSSVHLWDSAYHFFNYENTGGLDEGKFGYGRPFYQVTAVFLFWLLTFIGGIGVYTNRFTGLLIGIFPLVIGFLGSLLYLVVLSSRHLQYSATMVVNDVETEMTSTEQWLYIYKDPLLWLCLTISLLLLVRLVYKRLRAVKV
ncbi:hypothetical protein D770_04785 [Flammeovirgaceae bacterium 311]|nr:hypothetical protein D770_04785 [Flammeovirgaceae bacterium 311]